ncbi:hypothetical protein [Bosea sp. CS1GBMeth4]|uniref:hypothetical protein n=1 Tax=Bosea sp. CS1GBMeth4 TaxID=1892849 RepID=UPI0016491778|nr:hypothetical protein [Bosea sp. CS1GBMeth4]
MPAIKSLLAGAAALMLVTAPALAQPRTLGPQTGTVRIEQISVAFLASGELGGGTLTWRGRTYPISVGGLGIGGIGASRVLASGRVYGLTDRADFAGAYVQLKEGWALGRAGQGRLWLKNDKGVTISLDTRRQGLQATIGADGVVIAFK